MKKNRNKIFAAILAFSMFLTNLPTIALYADDSIKSMITYNNVMDYIEGASDLLQDYPCKFNNIIKLNFTTKEIYDKNDKKINLNDSSLNEIFSKENEQAIIFLEEQGYKLIENKNNIITIENPYQSKRIILNSDNLTTGNGATQILNYDDEYILQYSSEEETINAYNLFISEPSVKNVYLDTSVNTNEENIEDFYEIKSDSLNNGYKEHYSWGVSTMGLDTMQDNLKREDYNLDDIVVAVIDTGVNYNNMYLENRILTGYDFYNNDDDVMDDSGHGTHVTGIICDGTTDNVKILPIKALGANGKGSMLYVKLGILYALENNADVINISLSAEDTSKTITYLDDVIKKAKNEDCVICVSAGNDTRDVNDYYPSRNTDVITVGALDTSMTLAWYSNTGDKIDFCVPGSSIVSTYQNGLAYKSGTSMSTPHVAAAAALLKTYDNNLTVSQIKQIFIDYSVDIGEKGKDNLYGYGYINLANFDTNRTCKHEYVSNITKEATCTEKGILNYKCKKCSQTYNEDIPTVGHDYIKKVISSTCTEDGYSEYTCSRCKDTFTSDVTKAIGHNYISSITKMSTCTDEGIITYTCSNCTNSYTEKIEKLGHKYDAKITKEATCDEDGIRTYTCNSCGNSYTEIIPKNEHYFSYGIISPTCIEQGFTLFTCSDCNYTYKENFTDVLGHDYQILEQNKSTCKDKGYILYKCSRCDDSYKEETPKLQHTYSKETINPTCLTGGYTIYTCTLCKDTFKSDFIPALGHEYVEETILPTCKEDGYTINTCSRCNDSFIDTIIKTKGHDYIVTNISATCTKDGKNIYTCSICKDTYETEIKSPGHSLYKNTVDPTCEKNGYIEHICSICNYSYKESDLKAIGHNYNTKTIDSTCSEKGYDLHLCKNCNNSYKDNYINVIAHNFKVIEKVESNCLNNGYIKYQCETCKLMKNEDLLATGHNYNAKVIKPTCNDKGYTLYTCTKCDNKYTENEIPQLNHNYIASIEKQPNCNEFGIVKYSCSYCDDSYEEEIPKQKHNYDKKIIGPTCSEKGYTVYTCKNCENSYKDNYTDITPHDYLPENIQQATCDKEGYVEYVCTNCKITYKEVLPITNHIYESKVIEPTCESEGYIIYNCKDCKYTYKDNFSNKLEHIYTNKITKKSTCNSEGEIVYTCSNCNKSYKELIPKLEHEYSLKIVNSTCNEKGYTLYSCQNCEKSYKDNYTDIISHSYTSKITKQPTCNSEGEITYTCSFCKDYYVEKTLKLEHNYNQKLINPTCKDEGYILYTCTLCKDSYKDSYVDKIPHQLTEWIIDKNATCNDDGLRYKQCVLCNELIEKEKIKSLGHKYINTIIEPTNLEQGYTLHKCEVCNYSYKDNFTNCTNSVINSFYQIFDMFKNLFNKIFN